MSLAFPASPPASFTPVHATAHLPPFLDAIQNNPCGLPIVAVANGIDVSANNLCLSHLQQKLGIDAIAPPYSFTTVYAGATPTLASLAPSSVAGPRYDVLITATGTNYTAETVIVVGTTPCTTFFVSATSVQFILPAALQKAGTYSVYARTGAKISTPAVTLTLS